MRLGLADPPYLGRAHRNYGPDAGLTGFGRTSTPRRTAPHPAAASWDDPDTHRALMQHLTASFEGWAVAMAPDNLRHYLRWTPPDTRVASWHKPRSVPTGSRITTSWEPVLVFVPPTRRRSRAGHIITDTHIAPAPQTIVGAKPASWTRWVLDMLGYDPDTDTVTDLFPGTGAVTRESMQGVLL